jgi:hypothetical protein
MIEPEVDTICEGIAILILATIGISLEKISQAEAWLSCLPENVRQAVFLYIVGLIACEKKATNTKIAGKVGFLSHDSFNKALKRCKPLVKTMTIVLINFCLSQTTGHLIIDDCLVPKRYASNIEGVYNEFDHADNERVKGMRIVMIMWSNGQVRIPVAWAIWHKEKKYFLGRTPKGQAKYEHTGVCLYGVDGQEIPYRTKNQIALDLVEQVLERGLKTQYITFDSWYASRDNLISITENSFAMPIECYSRLKRNRKVIFQGQKMTVKEVDRLFAINTFNHKHGAYIKGVDVLLPEYGDIKLLLVRKDTHEEPDRTKYMFTTDHTASAPQILLRYRTRWAIETGFRDLKQELNVGSCQALSLDAQESHLALSIFAFVLLELLPDLQYDEQVFRTIGEKKKLLSQISLFSNPSRTQYWVINSSRPGTPFVPIEESNIDKVGLCFEFAYKTLLFPNFQRAA